MGLRRTKQAVRAPESIFPHLLQSHQARHRTHHMVCCGFCRPHPAAWLHPSFCFVRHPRMRWPAMYRIQAAQDIFPNNPYSRYRSILTLLYSTLLLSGSSTDWRSSTRMRYDGTASSACGFCDFLKLHVHCTVSGTSLPQNGGCPRTHHSES